MDDRLVTAAEVAAVLSVPTSWVREHTRAGDLPCVRLGRYVRYDLDRVRSWVAAEASREPTVLPRASHRTNKGGTYA